MTRWVCPRNGEQIDHCPTCRRSHVHLREEEAPANAKQKPRCYFHKIDLVPEKA